MEEKDKRNSNKGIFYAIIGIATLIVAIIGATFAYFTAAAQNGASDINGNMANIGFDLVVEKVVDPGVSSGIIPLSNSMIETAINDTTDAEDSKVNNTCVDDNGNAVCQVYKITVTNNSSATMFVDGYVALAGGSGTPIDTNVAVKNKTTMRWAQVFKQGGGADATSHYSTEGTQYLSVNTEEGTITMNSLDASSDTTGFNRTNILTSTGIISSNAAMISENRYDAVGHNFIRISEHDLTNDGLIDTTKEFTRTSDLTSMLVINQQVGAKPASGTSNISTFYFVVWLSETGYNQTATTESSNTLIATQNDNFFNGIVRFVSAQGSEVTATFQGYTAVKSDKAPTTATTTS